MMTCPGFEELSQFVDGEVEPSRRDEIRMHRLDCVRCAELIDRLSRSIDFPGGALTATERGATCLAPEAAVAYLLEPAGAGTDAIEAHLRQCSSCVEQVALIHRRLRRSSLLSDASAGPRSAPQSGAVQVGGSPRLRRAVTRLTRLPVLMPTALAAGALLTVAVHSLWFGPPAGDRMRSLPRRHTVEVAAADVPLRSRPDAGAEVVALLNRGAVLEVRGEEPRWYRVVLEDGREGWIERHVCE